MEFLVILFLITLYRLICINVIRITLISLKSVSRLFIENRTYLHNKHIISYTRIIYTMYIPVIYTNIDIYTNYFTICHLCKIK